MSSALRTSICDRFGLDVPIFGFAHSVAVAAAISRAGGVGIYGATRETPDEIRTGLAELRRRAGNRPIGVDLVLPRGMPDLDNRDLIEAEIGEGHRAFVRDLYQRFDVPPPSGPGMRSRFVRSNEMAALQIQAVLDSDVDFFACGIGAPPEAIAEAKARGKTTVALVGAPQHARAALKAGVEMLVAQGYDAGAHTGQIGTFSLVPQIVDIAGDVPVLAAGGVATGRHVAASLALGAAGVWVGTAWLMTREHAIKPQILAKLIAAGSADAVISRADSGKTLRQVRSAWSDAWAAPDAPKALKMPYQDILVGDLLGAIDEHEIEKLMHVPCGQSIAYFDRLTTVAEVMEALTSGAEAQLRKLHR